MKTVLCTAASMLLLLSSAQNTGARGNKDMANFRAAETAARSGATGSASAKHQWSADPKQGWVHAEEQHGLKNHSPRSKAIMDYKGQTKLGDKRKRF